LSWQVIFIHRDQRFVSINNTSFAASENALFSKNLTTNVVKTTNDGLSGQTILHYTIAQQAIKPW
jgi:myo-inositol-1-phosphate synthase